MATVAYRARPGRNDYRALWIASADTVIRLQEMVRLLRHEIETLRLEKQELEAVLEESR
jgi:hypothetical protein